MPAISMRKVNKYFGDHHALKDIDLDIEVGRVVAILGPSGSGKSTLCRCINRLEKLDTGSIWIEGEALPEESRELSKFRAQIGMVFQSFNLFSHYTILENVMLAPLKVQRRTKEDARSTALELLGRVGISAHANKYPSQLSGGQQQRAAIARALAMKPTVMLFDEPTSALDPEMINEVLDVIADITKMGTTMVIVTHEMGFARRVADEIVFMDKGSIVERAEPEQFFTSPRTERAQKFLSHVGSGPPSQGTTPS